MRALTFLVISCPCAVVISVPLSFFGGIGCASKNGILVKGSNYLEILSDTKTIVFDKTGTLTKGVFEVTGIYVSDSFMKTISNPSDKNIKSDAELKLLGYAAAAEAASSHPIAQSICKAYKEKAGSIEVSEKKIGHYRDCRSWYSGRDKRRRCTCKGSRR